MFGIGIWAERSRKPFGFWTGKAVKPETITDILAYNRENSRMWKAYSVPFFSISVCYIVGIWLPKLQILSVVGLFLVCTLGIGWLIWKYRHILSKYSVK